MANAEATKAYLEKHNLQAHFQSALEHICKTMPEDPLKAAAEFFLNDAKQQACPRGMTGGTWSHHRERERCGRERERRVTEAGEAVARL